MSPESIGTRGEKNKEKRKKKREKIATWCHTQRSRKQMSPGSIG
jgi:hypothetical protein